MNGRVFVRAVIGFERQYAVSNTGEIFSFPRNGNWELRKLKPRINHNGYEKVTLTKNNKRSYYFVHRIVAENFLENPEGKRTVNHINGIKTDNSIFNLEWNTHSENSKHAYRNNLVDYATGERMSKKLTNNDVDEILKMRKKGMTHKSISIKFGVRRETIRDILNGRRWFHHTGLNHENF